MPQRGANLRPIPSQLGEIRAQHSTVSQVQPSLHISMGPVSNPAASHTAKPAASSTEIQPVQFTPNTLAGGLRRWYFAAGEKDFSAN